MSHNYIKLAGDGTNASLAALCQTRGHKTGLYSYGLYSYGHEAGLYSYDHEMGLYSYGHEAGLYSYGHETCSWELVPKNTN